MRKTYRTAQGFRDWAFDHNLQVATEHEDEETFQLFVECRMAILVVTFAKIDGRVRDAALHIEHGPTHQLGMYNSLSTLNGAFLRYHRTERSKRSAT